MHKKGFIVRWYPERAFGFIRPADAQGDLFFHLRDFRGAELQPPHKDMEVSYEEVDGSGGRGPRAVRVQPRGLPKPAPRSRVAEPPQSRSAAGKAIAPLLILAYAVVLVWAVWNGKLPLWVLPLSWVLNLLAFFAYWQDKHAAGQDRWRTGENALHLWSLAGGWPGAWVAQQGLRHKTRKHSFLRTYWLSAAAHSAVLVLWLWGAQLHRLLLI